MDREKLTLGAVGLDALNVNYTSASSTATEIASYKFGELTTTSFDVTGAMTGTSSFSLLTHNTTVRAATITTLAASVNPSVFGQPVTFTATVKGADPTGTVTFRDGETVLNVATLSSGVATFTISTMTPGTHHITVTYNGDLLNKSSATLPVIWPVHLAATTITLIKHSSTSHVLRRKSTWSSLEKARYTASSPSM